MNDQASKDRLTCIYGEIGGVIAKLRDSSDSLGASKLPLSKDELVILDCLDETKKSLIQQRVEISKLGAFEPITEPEALKKVREFAQDMRREHQKEVNLFCSDFEDHPIQALTDEMRVRQIIRSTFCIDLFEKVGLYSEDVAWVDVLYRLESSIIWMIKQVCSSPQATNPNNLLEIITWRWYRECVIELTFILGLSDRKPNPVLDLYQMVVELSIRAEKHKIGLKGA